MDLWIIFYNGLSSYVMELLHVNPNIEIVLERNLYLTDPF